MPSLIDLNEAANVAEPQAVEENEYKLVITSGERKESKKGNPMVQVSFEITGEELTPPVFHYVILPTTDLSKKDQQRRLLDIKRFAEAFNIEVEMFSTCVENDNFEAIVGQEGWALLVQDEYEGRISNKIKRFVVSA
jgi:hypothetical protein